MKVVLSLSLLALASAGKFDTYSNHAPAYNVELARYINAIKPGWTASETPYPIFANRTHLEAKRLMGTRLDKNGPVKLARKTYPKIAVPDQFDAATNWPNCATITQIRDQSACGSCWAFGAVEAMSDRLCTMGKGKYGNNVSISAMEMMSCCDECGSGCEGGYPDAAWSYWVQNGLVDSACLPYPFPMCAHHVKVPGIPSCPSSLYPTPACPTMCAKSSTPVSSAAQYQGANSWSLSGESDFQTELMTNGPFEVTMSVYQDFETYKSGIYKHVSGPFLGGHAVRLVGWGVENGVKFWKIANSWNPTWGEKGYFRIVRGEDECNIEDAGSAGQPL